MCTILVALWLHVPVNIIHDACKNINSFDLSNAILYTTGEPCPMCMGAILWANISKVYYGCNVIDTEIIGFRDNKFYNNFNNRENLLKELDREECLKLYNEYNKIINKTNY